MKSGDLGSEQFDDADGEDLFNFKQELAEFVEGRNIAKK